VSRTTNVSRQRAFLSVFGQTGNIKLAAQAAGIVRMTHYRWMEDEEYRGRFEEAKRDALDTLHAEAHRRGVLGWDEPVVYQGAICYTQEAKGKPKKPVAIRKYDSNLLMFLMKGLAPETYRDTWRGEIKHSGSISRGPDLSRLTDEQLADLKRIAQSAIPAAEAIVESAVDRSGGAETGETED
jgi:hypothetical protein